MVVASHKHPNLQQVGTINTKFEAKISPIGIVNGVDGKVSDSDAYGFFEAADAFAATKPWTILKSIRYRHFRLRLDPTSEQQDNEDAVNANSSSSSSSKSSFEMFDVVKLHGLASASGSKLNGLQGEVIPEIPPAKLHNHDDTRFGVRLFQDGRTVAIRAACLTLVHKHDPNRDFVVKVARDGYKVDIYKSWASMHQHLCHTDCYGKSPPCRSTNPACGTFCVSLVYMEAANDFADVALRKRLGFGALPGRGEFPIVLGKSADRERLVTRIELKALEAGVRAAVQFIPKLAENPIPPPPYFLPLTFRDRQDDYIFHRGDGGGGGVIARKNVGNRLAPTSIRACCSFPSGNLLARHYRWRSYPAVVARFAPRPFSVITVEQAIIYHRSELEKAGASYEKIRADTRVGNFCLLAHKYGLANALWEADEENLVREALDIGRKILDIEFEMDPKDSHFLRPFVVDVSLQVGDWDAATAVLAKFPEIVDEDLVWNAVLIYFKSRGPESKSTLNALEEAVRFNPVVYSLLVGDRLLDEDEAHRCRQKGKQYFTANGRNFGVPHNAPIFYLNYSKYFFQDPALVPWLESQRETLKPLLNINMEKPLDSPIEDSLADYFAAAAVGDIGIKKKSAASKLGNDTVCCANCGGIGDLAKCARCLQVSYCSRQCQVRHYKDHKAVCRKSAKEQGGQQARASDRSTTAAQEEHPSWARLNLQTRQNLLKFHKDGGWEPWPVTAEAPAMLNHPCYSFLTAHPAMTFSAVVQETPHGFQMSYDNPTGSNVHGQMFESGQAPFLLLRENLSMPGPNNKIPIHNMGMPMEFCLVAEVRFTMSCKLAFTNHYNHDNQGSLFDWPGIEAIVTCPGTGESIEPDNNTVVILAAFNMYGYYMEGSKMSHLTRVIPRLVTLEGMERLMGEPGSSKRLASFSGPGRRPGCEERQEIYPNLLRRFAGQKPNKLPKRLPSADNAWDGFHSSGRYCSFEQYCSGGHHDFNRVVR